MEIKESKESFLEEIKKLTGQKIIYLENTSGIIIDIEEVEYKIFKLTLQIEGKIYTGIYKQYDNLNEVQKNNRIKLFMIELIKKERNIFLYSSGHCEQIKKEDINIVAKKEDIDIYDLNPPSLIETITKNSGIIYKSDIFIYKQKTKEFALIPILEEKEFIVNNSNENEFKKFILENKLKNDSLIFIENYLLDKNNISFNYVTLFNMIKLEYLDEYFKKKFKLDYKNKNIIYYKINSKNVYNFALLKIIDIQDEYILGIDYFLNIYKIFKNTEKIKDIQDVYTILFIKDFSTSIEDSFFLLSLKENSYVYIFDNNFCDLFLNDLTVLNLNFIDFNDDLKTNYFNQIGFDTDNFSFEISKKYENIILIQKFNFNNNFYPFSIKLINNKEIHSFQFILYFGLLNNINCLVNYFGKETYGYEYFYFNFTYDLPEFQSIQIEKKKYLIEKSDHFNSKARKRFILLNYYDIENTKIYKDKIIEKKKKQDEKINKQEENKGKNDIIMNVYDLKDFLDDEDEIISHDSILYCFFYEKEKKKLLGIYEIKEINNNIPIQKDNLKLKKEYKIFYNFLKIMGDINIDVEKKEEYLKSIKKYNNDLDIKQLVNNYDIDFSNINYENYLIFINICLFYYYNQTPSKNYLIREFKSKFELLKKSNISYNIKIRIMRFICREIIINGNRNMNLLLMDDLENDSSYKIAINYNINMINNLNEKSKLYIPFLQLDSYILYNYFINSYSYTLSLEPLILTKKHLLSSYDNFIFTYKEKEKDNFITLAFQHTYNDVTAINEFGLFPSNNIYDSYMIKGNNYAVPISLELLHERNGHSKKSQKNKRNLTPLYFYTKKKIIRADKDYQELDDLTKQPKGEAGLLVEYFIRYKKKSLIKELKYNCTLGNIIKNTNLFIGKNFKELANEVKNNKQENKSTQTQLLSETCLSMNKVKITTKKNDINPYLEKAPAEESLEYYEKNYLMNGKIFVYPYSIPVDYKPYGEKKSKISVGKIKYLEKYQNAIIKGRKSHYGQY